VARWGAPLAVRVAACSLVLNGLIDWQDAWLRQSLLGLLRDLGMK
jgi:hypothetical protein